MRGSQRATTPRSIRLVDAGELDGRRVLDIRQRSEYLAGHLPGAMHVELGDIPQRVEDVSDEPTVVMCGHGERAMGAASMLEAAGHHNLVVLDGGPQEWVEDTGGRLETGGMSTPRSTATWVARQPHPVLSAGAGQRARRRHGRPGTDRAAASGRAALPPHWIHLPADLRVRLRHHQGRHQLLRRHLVGSLRTQARAAGGLADRHPGATDADLGAVMGVGDRGQRAAGCQSGPDLVNHRHHEDRPRRTPPTRAGHGLQRGRRLRRGRASPRCWPATSPPTTDCARHRFCSAFPTRSSP